VLSLGKLVNDESECAPLMAVYYWLAVVLTNGLQASARGDDPSFELLWQLFCTSRTTSSQFAGGLFGLSRLF